jgi:hypothetical protein
MWKNVICLWAVNGANAVDAESRPFGFRDGSLCQFLHLHS